MNIKQAMEKMFQLFIAWFCLCGTALAAKVMILPLNYESHIIYHAKIARLLAEEDHEVDIILPSHIKIPDTIRESEVNIVIYDMDGNAEDVNRELLSRIIIEKALTNSIFRQLTALLNILNIFGSSRDRMKAGLINDDNARNRINSMHYDVAIVDLHALHIYTSLNISKGIPVIGYGILCFEWSLGIPSLPSFVPMLQTRYTDKMSYFERLINSLIFAVNHIIYTMLSDPPIPIRHLRELCSFYFVLDDISMSYPRPTMPNIAFVGDAIPDPGKPLPREIEEFVDSAEHGVVVASFGSYLEYLPYGIVAKFCSAFESIPQKVIWKQNNSTLCGAANDKIRIFNWIPQNDLLSHKNVKLLISHCGKNSILEAIYHSTPALCFPISADQPHTAYTLASRGLGRVLHISKFSSDELVSEISLLLADTRISTNMQTASSLLRNKSDTASRRISYWVQHLALYGADHLRTNALELNIFQFYCLDVILVIFVIFVLIGFSVVYFFKRVLRLVNLIYTPKSKTD